LAQEKTSFSAIVDRVQRDRALALLVTSDLPIATIATDVGFSAPATLTRAVHRWTGLSPTEYRRRCQP
jgi:AraC-like DNA-binding protein